MKFMDGKSSTAFIEAQIDRTPMSRGYFGLDRTIFSEINKKLNTVLAGTRARQTEAQVTGAEVLMEDAIHPYTTCANINASLNSPLNQKEQLRNRSSSSSDEDISIKRQKTEHQSVSNLLQLSFRESRSLQDARRRTYSHWPKKFNNFIELLIASGFFACNVGDRSICIYCNIICQQWDIETDDPVELHRLVSPKCPFVISIINRSDDDTNASANLIETNVTPKYPHYADAQARRDTFKSELTIFFGKIDQFIDAGFFYSGTEDGVTCFSCGGSLSEWTEDDDPITRHGQAFPDCHFVKNQYGDGMHRRLVRRPTAPPISSTVPVSEALLSRLVAARLDLPVSQRLLDRGFRLSIIKRVWEDQLRLKNDDFASDTDVYLACEILQKQIDHINGNKENIIIPKKKLEEIRNRAHNVDEQMEVNGGASITSTAEAEKKVPDPPVTERKEMPVESGEVTTTYENPCLVCGKGEKQLACMPCGHLTSCMGCSQRVRTCPTCRREIEAYVRVYL